MNSQQPLKILIAEDDMIIQLFITRIIKSAGFEVLGKARTGEGVLSSVQRSLPDLVLMDIGLTGRYDGIETAQILKDKYSISVIFVTGNSDDLILERARELCPVAIMPKPINEQLLIQEIKKYQTSLFAQQ